jgi:hypothetical protein
MSRSIFTAPFSLRLLCKAAGVAERDVPQLFQERTTSEAEAAQTFNRVRANYLE